MNKKQFKDWGKEGAKRRWEEIVPPQRMALIQELYKYRPESKDLIDWMTAEWGIERLEKLRDVEKQKYEKRNNI